MFGKLTDERGNEVLRIVEGSEYVLGREPDDDRAGLVIDDGFASRKHGVIRFADDFSYEDLFSKNGSFINEERLVPGRIRLLCDGDVLRIGRCEYHFIIDDGRPKRRPGVTWSMKSSAGGRRLQVELEERGCIEYQLHMIEENPELKIAEVIHVSRIDRDCFLCDVGGFFSLSDTVLRKEKSLDIVDLIDRILRLVKLGEEHMLERGKYILDPECVFISPEGELLLTYVPCSYEMERDFAADMLYLCRFIRENCCDYADAYSNELESIFEDKSCDTKDYIKYIYRYKDMDSEYDSADQKELSVNKARDKKKNGKDKKKNVGKRRGNIIRYVVTLISFVIFMVVFWVGIMSITNMAGIFLVLVGINVLVYGVGSGNSDEEDPNKKIRRDDRGKKKSEAVLFKRGSGRRKEKSVLSLKR